MLCLLKILYRAKSLKANRATNDENLKPMNPTDFSDPLQQANSIEKLVQVVARLRHPTQGCPWDLKQTHQTLKPYMLEEAYEAVEAIDEAEHTQNPATLKEELGDVLLQVVLHSQLAQEAGHFDFDAVCDTIAEKLIRRHPHVFGSVEATDADTVVANWEAIKKSEKAQNAAPLAAASILSGISKSQPALSRALETSKKAVKVGFEWPSLESLWECVMSEYEELREEIHQLENPSEISSGQFERLELEMGDILFASVNLASHFKIDPEVALTKATAKFTRRFQTMEKLILEQADPDATLETAMAKLSFEDWDQLWNAAKNCCNNSC
jgi:MazG family protein